MGLIALAGQARSIFTVGKKIKNHIYTRRNFRILLNKHSALTKQLRQANEALADYASKEVENQGLAYDYCADYGIPVKLETQDETDNSGEQTPQS